MIDSVTSSAAAMARGAIAGSALVVGAVAFSPAAAINEYAYDRVDQAASIADLAIRSGGEFDDNSRDFDILLNAVLAADLAGALSDPTTSLTVFAPTDAAFIKLANDLGYTGSDEAGAFDAIVAALTELGGGDPIPVLTDVLLYHVVPGTVGLYQVRDNVSVETLLEGATLVPFNLSLQDNEPDLEDPQIVVRGSNIFTGNGLVHAISGVLLPVDLPSATMPMTITDMVAASGGEFDGNRLDFDMLLNAVLAAGLQDALADPEASLTVLAPNDRAFIALALQLGYDRYDEAGAFEFIVETLTTLGGGDPIPLLTDILTYHVLPESVTAKQIIEADEITTLQGASISGGLIIGDQDPDFDPALLQIEASDMPASNGRIHTISRVLIPADL